MNARRQTRRCDEIGATYLEVLTTLVVILVLLSSSLIATRRVGEEDRVRSAAAVLAGQFRAARQDAALRSASTAVVFDETAGGWTYRICRDGNGNGVRRSEIGAGTDTCGAATRISDAFPGVTIGVDETLPGPDGEAGSADPVRFGRGNLASFSPDGTCTSGTLFLRSLGTVFYAIRTAGVTGRTRLLKFQDRRWVEP